MPGLALSDKFMLGTATLMIGALADLQSLGVAQSLGLAKNVGLKTTPGFVELTQGVKNNVVTSVQNKNDMTVDAEIFEYSSRNMTYAVSLDGSALVPAVNATTTTSALTAAGGPPLVTPAVIPVASATGMAAGGWLAIHIDGTEQIFYRRIVSIATLNVTVSSGMPVSVPSGAKVEVVNVVPLGSTKDNPFLSAKITGQLADNSWVTILIGKCRVTSGVSLAFKTDNFDNIPFQLTVYDLNPNDPNYNLFVDPTDGTVSKALILSVG